MFKVQNQGCPPLFAQRSQAGFTLIELMIVVAIIGILASIALPSYQESVRKSRRVELQRTMADAEQFMRRYYGAKDTYTGASLPTNLATSPSSGTAAYSITATVTATTFSLVGAPKTGGTMVGDRCGSLTVTQTGARSISGQTSGLTLADCFKGN